MNWVIKLHDRRNNITKYDCGEMTADLVFNADINKAVLHTTRRWARELIALDKKRRPDFYADLKKNKIYVYPVKVLITEAS